jgi:hypothetical protein
MTSMNHNRRPILTKLGMLFLIALVPSVASARQADHWASSAKICYPNAQTCQTLRGTDMWNELTAMNMPYALTTSCSGNPSYCTRSMLQTWTMWIDTGVGYGGPYTSVNPVVGHAMSYSPPPNLPGGCGETNDYETYTCTAGTGGPGWSWVITATYW